MHDNPDSVNLATTRRRFLAACTLAGVTAFIPGIGLLDKHGTLDETVTTPPSGYTREWQLREDGGEWTTVGYGETFTVPALNAGAYWMRTIVTMPNDTITIDSESTVHVINGDTITGILTPASRPPITRGDA